MLSSKAPRTATRLFAAGAVLTLGALSLPPAVAVPRAASPAGSASGEKVGVSLIVKTTTNPFFVAMEDGAKKAAEAGGVDLKLAAGKSDGDEDTQIQAIENAISKGDKGILITPNGPSVVDAIKKARDAGLYVIALDTPPDPAERRRHHLRHGQLRRRQADRPVDRGAAGWQEGHHRPRRPLRRQGRLGRLQPRPGLPDRAGHRHRRQDEERRRGQDRQVHRRQGRRLRDRRQPGLPGRRGRRPHGHGNPAVQEPEHQRRLHDQRTRRSRRLSRP